MMVTTTKRIEGPPPSTPATSAEPAGPAGPVVENLDDLGAEAARLQAGEKADQTRTENAEQQAQQQAQANDRADTVSGFAKFLVKTRNFAADVADQADWLPRDQVHTIWTDARMTEIADAGIEFAEAHSAWLEEMLRRYGPTIALVATVAVPSWATVQAARAHKARTVEASEVKSNNGAAGG